MGGLAQLGLISVLVCSISLSSASPHEYDSVIKAGVHTSYWGVTNDECTSVHAVNITTGSLQWRRSPVDEEQTWSVATERRAFFTLTSGPSVSAVSLDSGSLKWTWPKRVGHVWNRRWQTDLSQNARLAAPMPALQAQILLVRAEEDSKVLALDLVNGNLTWEFDALATITQAAASAGLSAPQDLTVTGWELEGPRRLYVSLSAAHTIPLSPSPTPSPTPTPSPSQNPSHTSRSSPAAAVHGWLPDSWQPSNWWPSGWWPFNGDHHGSADTDAVSYGWVLALDAVSGEAVWVSGPMELLAAQLVLSDTTLLVASEGGQGGSGFVYGLNKDTGVLEYTLPCDLAPCPVQIADTRIGLLTAGLKRSPPDLTRLSAFDLSSGSWLWQGLPVSSQLAAYVTGSCTGIAATRPHLYFACTCSANGSDHAAAGSTSTQARMPVSVASQQAGSVDSDQGSGVAGKAKPKPKPKPRPPLPAEPTGLCAFAVSAETGRIGYEVVLSATDSVPTNASDYKYSPLVMADTVVYRGRFGVYALPALDTSPQPTDTHTATATAGSLSELPAQTGAAAATAASQSQLPAQRHTASHPYTVADDNKPAIPPKLRYTFHLPVGLESQSWDWLELKAGRLLFQVSVPRQSDGESDNRLSRLSLSRLWSRFKRRVGAQPVSGRIGGGVDPPLASTWLFALDASNGTAYWALATNMSLSPRTPRTTPHEWARGGLLLVDGCRAPLDEAAAAAAAAGGADAVAGRATARPAMRLLSWRPLSHVLSTRRTTHIRTSTHTNTDSTVTATLSGDPAPSGDGGKSGEGGDSGAHAPTRTPTSTDAAVLNTRSGDDKGDSGQSGEGGPSESGEGENDLPGEDVGEGTSCCLFAVSVESGSVAWRHCFDMDRACASGVSRRTATWIVYALLGCLVVVAILGCILHMLCLRRHRRAVEQASLMTVMQDPDSEYEALLVAVPGAPGITQPTSHRLPDSDSD